jgi:3'-phosphoadenosine 5'-phosphosulfate sulfotransferase (PAPS reductase)/FAD synthetase
MLWRVLQAHQMSLPDECVVAFANTGLEAEETLQFVRDCGTHWNVPITWVEYRNDEVGYAVVNFEAASRNGEPFKAICDKRQYLPNPVTRFCTVELKIRIIAKLLKSLGMLQDVADMMIGIRADEPRRVAKMRKGTNSESSKISNCVPLADAGVSVGDVGAFWDAHPFSLNLPSRNGRTTAGNCELCFLKPSAQVMSLIREKPSRAIWWVEAEAEAEARSSKPSGARFRSDRPSYARMLQYAIDQVDAFGHDDSEAIACFCGD